MRIAYFDCMSGISGDMTIAAFLDAGLSMKTLKAQLARLNLKGYEIKESRTNRGSIDAVKFDVICKNEKHSHRKLKDILRLIDKSALDAEIKKTAKDIFNNIGNAEAKVHGLSKNQEIDFDEIGQVDSIIDIVAVAIAVHELKIGEVYSSNITFGRSFTKTAHGSLPIPAPAALELLKGVPARICEIEAELVTPTGAGILKTLARGFGDMPELKISQIGYGAGTRVLKNMPNLLRVVIGERVPAYMKDRVTVLETNIDDMNPQNFEYLFERLFKEGALDVFLANIIMKKSRPAFKLTVLAEPVLAEKMKSVIFSETSTIGIRYYEVNRSKLERETRKVHTGYGDVTVKFSSGPGNLRNVAPEYEDCVRLAKAKKIPLKVVYEEAKKAIKV
ncbi:MAG: nickel pincer cofactor biosynthesis protein LarC [Candidatus Omnitrophica bacterium]|nr:nickel pincer cofactor biosynthesis protein LarC [Candidatus Omnitrophota bacterium]